MTRRDASDTPRIEGSPGAHETAAPDRGGPEPPFRVAYAAGTCAKYSTAVICNLRVAYTRPCDVWLGNQEVAHGCHGCRSHRKANRSPRAACRRVAGARE